MKFTTNLSKVILRMVTLIGPWNWLFRAKHFKSWEAIGWHIVPDHFYQPIPSTKDLETKLWDVKKQPVAFDFRESFQLELLKTLSKYSRELNALLLERDPFTEKLINQSQLFGPVDLDILYGLIREIKPNRIVEIGSGLSTYISAKALLQNRVETGNPTHLLSIEPFPQLPLITGFPGLSELRQSKVQNVDLGIFDLLESGDILFIDSTHVYKLGSDVQFEFSKIIPRLKSGVYVHFHDIFLPSEYPEHWVRSLGLFWNEQHILENFLAFNTEFEVIWGSSYMHLFNSAELTKVIPGYNREFNWPGSFWIRRLNKQTE
jgi:hypothetical protein